MAKAKPEETLLEKAMGHKVKKQGRKAVTKEKLKVYVAYMNGEVDVTQACYALDVSNATFRGQVGSIVRDAIMSDTVDELEFSDND